jgi:hypothetical protein
MREKAWYATPFERSLHSRHVYDPVWAVPYRVGADVGGHL